MEQYKNIIIGFGKGGKTLAKDLAGQGESVLVIEQSEQMFGGTCINIACIPSKSLIVNAESGMNFEEAMNVKNNLVSKLREKNYHNIADEEHATVLTGKASFTSDNEITVTLSDGSIKEVTGDRIFINTGATPVIPPIDGLKDSRHVLDSTSAMDQSKLPESLVIIGAGNIGLEFAAMFTQYGSKVTVLDASDDFLPQEDRDVADMVLDDLQDLGIEFHLGVQIEKVTDNDQSVTVTYSEDGEEKTVEGSKVLTATGRKPNTNGLGLDNTTIKINDQGAIAVDSDLKTAAENVWAIGDVKGGLQFTYISLDDYRIIKSQLSGENSYNLNDRTVVPYTMFINPSFSHVGLHEDEANEKDIEYKLFKFEASSVPKANVLRNPKGVFKILVDPNTGKVLGATIYAEESHELINLITLAMKGDLPYTLLRDQIYTHPTMSEALNSGLK